MKIFMLCDFYNESLEYQENLLVKYYTKHGHDVMVVASTFESVFDYYNDHHNKSAPPRDYQDGKARIVKLPYRFNLLNRLRAYTRIDGLLDEFRPDLIYVHDIMLNLPECVRYVKAHPNTKMILDYHADYSNSGKNWLSLKVLHGVLRKHYLDRARPHLSGIFPIVPGGATFLHEVYGVPLQDMELLPLGADTDLGAEIRDSGARAALRQRYGFTDEHCVLFSGGKLDPLKQTEALIDAFKALALPHLRLVIIGEASAAHTDYKQMLLHRAEQHPHIHFAGWQSARSVYEHLDMADVAVFPASQSILWQQAISMGLPLVVGDRTTVARGKQDIDYLNQEGNVVVLDDCKPMVEELVHHLGELAKDPATRAKMAAGARLVTARLLDWNVLIEKTLRGTATPTHQGLAS